MRISPSALARLAMSTVLAAVSLSGCSGGGSSVPPPANPATTNFTGTVSIDTLNVMQPAGTTPVNATGSTPAGPTTDIHDAATATVTSALSATITSHAEHLFASSLRGTNSAHRAPQDVAVNSPFDVTYFGGVVLGSAVSHDVFVNYPPATRAALNFDPGSFLTDLGNDRFITLMYQYLVGPGVTSTPPINGRYTKGRGTDNTTTFKPPLPGDTNAYIGQLDIWLQVLAAAHAPGLGGGGDGNIYHVFLPKGVDTCFDAPLGTPSASCYSPDNFNTFVFCAYHGVFTAGGVTYLYSVEPNQDVGGCRNGVSNQALPNAVSATVDPADPGYSTLSHELFETLSDPHVDAWFNGLFGGLEIADECASFDNFVTVSRHPYVLQSEYSDVFHICVSASLTGAAQTPQNRGN